MPKELVNAFHDVAAINEMLARGELALPAPPHGLVWSLRAENPVSERFPEGDASKLTVVIRCVSKDSRVVRQARIAVDLYGWSAVAQRCESLARDTP